MPRPRCVSRDLRHAGRSAGDLHGSEPRANLERLVAALEPLAPYLRAAGRPKDLERIAELETLRDELRHG